VGQGCLFKLCVDVAADSRWSRLPQAAHRYRGKQKKSSVKESLKDHLDGVNGFLFLLANLPHPEEQKRLNVKVIASHGRRYTLQQDDRKQWKQCSKLDKSHF